MRKFPNVLKRLASFEEKLRQGPDFRYFINQPRSSDTSNFVEARDDHAEENILANKKFSLKTFGCQMNSNDSEIVRTILQSKQMTSCESHSDADIALINTCAIRENAEQKIWTLVNEIRYLKEARIKNGQKFFIGILGCMAERLREKIVEEKKFVDLIVGPDSYKDLPRLLNYLFSDLNSQGSNYAINVQLSLDETYADVIPVRRDQVSAFVSIMRGCSNMCSFCIVPFTRGVERSRPLNSIIEEVKALQDTGVKEITLLGQNVNSYFDETSQTYYLDHRNAQGFGETYKRKNKPGARFVHLLERVAYEAPEIRFRFTSPHPKDFANEVLELIKNTSNICKYLHMPAQSGSNLILNSMNRKYTVEAYLDLIHRTKETIPGVALSTDIIVGFCGETDDDFEQTLKLMDTVKFDTVFL